jgi:hypothetical protein
MVRFCFLGVEALEDRWAPATLTVLNASDSGPGSLRDAIQTANQASVADTIIFDPALGGKTITLTSGELLITSALTISGPGADRLTIDGGHASRIFEIGGGATVTLSGLKIANGFDPLGGGGAIRNDGDLTIDACWLDSNTSNGGNTPVGDVGGGWGAAAVRFLTSGHWCFPTTPFRLTSSGAATAEV